MKFLLSALLLLATGCVGVVRDEVPIKTQVVTFPEGAIVEFNGRAVGRAPAAVILPQDTNGRLIERTVLRAVPNTAQPMLVAQTRVLEPDARTERVPHQIMIDLTVGATNQAAPSSPRAATLQNTSTNNAAAKRRPMESGKPTRPVGIDRWNPGIY